MRRADVRQQRLQIRGDRREVERLLAGKVRNAEAAADVEQRARAPARARRADRELHRFLLRLDDRLGAQILRAAENVKAAKLERQPCDVGEHLRHALGIDAELLRAAAHLHARGLELEIRIHAHRDARTLAAASASAASTRTSRSDSTLIVMPAAAARSSSARSCRVRRS